jgi:hypothetical protein
MVDTSLAFPTQNVPMAHIRRRNHSNGVASLKAKRLVTNDREVVAFLGDTHISMFCFFIWLLLVVSLNFQELLVYCVYNGWKGSGGPALRLSSKLLLRTPVHK